MKVLFLNYEYPPLGGGAANATSYILREYSKIPNLEVDLVTSSADNNFHLEKIGENIQIHKLPIGKNEKNLHFQSQKDLLVYSWKAYWYCKKLIKKNEYNLSHSFFTVPCGFLSLLFLTKHKIPYIVSLRGADVPGYSERFSGIYGILTPLIKHIWKKSFATVANSEGLKELALKSNPRKKIEVIYNGIDTEQFKPKENETEQSRKEFVVLCISRLTRRKGISYLISAIKKLSSKYPEIKLKIAGEGDAQKELEDQVIKLNIQNSVDFLGRIAHDKVANVYSSAKIFVLPSLNEGMSNTMLEALASGLPIVATDTGGTKELVEDGKNGFIVKMKDSRDIADKIEIFLKSSELCQKMALESRKKALEMSWEKVAGKYYKLYEEIK